jgi:hypothetical protein
MGKQQPFEMDSEVLLKLGCAMDGQQPFENGE